MRTAAEPQTAWSCKSFSARRTRGILFSPVINPRRGVKTSRCAAMNATTEAGNQTTIKRFEAANLSQEDLAKLIQRPRIDFEKIFSQVKPIVADVQNSGDAAVVRYTEKFDNVVLEQCVVPVADMPDSQLEINVQNAFDVAFANISTFHSAQKSEREAVVETMPGVKCMRVARPIEAVGLYVPGGSAVLPSTALMLAIPAKIAGCKTIVLATPPRSDGSISPEVLYVAKKAGVTHILKAGGAQAIAALAFGTQSCPKVDKIFGPGNQYVTAAKMVLQNAEAMISIDMPAGPSEVLVIADEGANPTHVAIDLLSQAEHGPDSQVVLLCTSQVNIAAIETEIEKQLETLPRADITSQALEHSFVIKCRDVDEACEISNLYAPEHLIINVDNPEAYLPKIVNAGSVFLGRWTPESVGDYASGTNHVLPTYGYARMYSGVSLDTFQKKITVQSLTEQGIQNLGPSVALMADVEGLEAHRRAVTLRLESLNQ